MEFGRETVTLVEIDQPLCSRQYGDAAGSPPGGCAAVLGVTGTRKCFNTRATCQDSTNYNPFLPGSPTTPNTLTLRFSYPQEGLLQYGPLIPSMTSLETQPAAINLAAMDRNISPLGSREVVTIKCDDHLHSDLAVDPYRLERPDQIGSPTIGTEYDPYLRGTFWGKWLARNPYHSGYRARVYQGFMGDAVEDMRCSYYVLDRVEGPTNGEVTVVLKDLFSLIEDEKAVAPLPSRGELSADLTVGGTSFTLLPSGIGNLDYAVGGSPESLYVAIGDEIIAANRAGDNFTVTQRGALGTTADTHDEEDLVQLVLSYTTELHVDVLYDLLLNYTSLTSADLPKAAWDIALAQLTTLNTARIGKPLPVADLVGELAEQAGFTVWPDIETGLIKVQALRQSAPTATVTDDEWIVDQSIEIKRADDKRASEVWVYYGQINPMIELDEPRNFHSRIVTTGENLYITPVIKNVFSRWIPQFGRSFAEECGERLYTMFVDPPVEVNFKINNSRDGQLNLAEFFSLETADVQDDTGAVLPVTMATTGIKRMDNEIEIDAQEVVFAEPEDSSAQRVIYIENTGYNLNLRTIHDSLYTAPVGGSPGENVHFIINAGIIIGSTSTATPAIITGNWPSGVTLSMQNLGRAQGKGGQGGGGGNGGIGFTDGGPGAPGGPALQATYPLALDNASGQLWGGGGGGGGGGGSYNTFDLFSSGGGGGGGGSGTDGGITGDGGDGPPAGSDGFVGDSGTAEAGGNGGGGGPGGGAGGAGGGPGLTGDNGTTATGGNLGNGAGGAGGAAGKYIDGIAFVTMSSPTGDVRGNVS